MAAEQPREYGREYTKPLAPSLRERLGYSHERGNVTRFVVQLEYRLGGDWTEVVRYDHDPESEHGHDVEDEGLHIDVYRDGKRLRTEYIAPAMTGRDGPGPGRRPFSDERRNVRDEVRGIARDKGPMTDGELAEARGEIEALREVVREDLAADLGGDPEDFRAEEPVPDGGGG